MIDIRNGGGVAVKNAAKPEKKWLQLNGATVTTTRDRNWVNRGLLSALFPACKVLGACQGDPRAGKVRLRVCVDSCSRLVECLLCLRSQICLGQPTLLEACPAPVEKRYCSHEKAQLASVFPNRVHAFFQRRNNYDKGRGKCKTSVLINKVARRKERKKLVLGCI